MAASTGEVSYDKTLAPGAAAKSVKTLLCLPTVVQPAVYKPSG
jgi:hypothetical protein